MSIRDYGRSLTTGARSGNSKTALQRWCLEAERGFGHVRSSQVAKQVAIKKVATYARIYCAGA